MRKNLAMAAAASGLVLVSAVTAVAAFTLNANTRTPPSAASIVLETGNYGPLLDNCLDPARTPPERGSECVLNLVKQATAAMDFGPAMALLRESTNRTYDMVGRCHNATHEVGYAMIEAGMPLEEVYTVPFPDCRFGMYHGALGKTVEHLDIEELKSAMPTLCEPFGGPETNANQECVHVLGHFVVDRIGTDLHGSLEACEVFPDPSAQSRCTDGVFMQAVDLSRPGVHDPGSEAGQRIAKTWGTTRDEQEATAAGVCLSIENEYSRYVCYTAVSQTLAVLWDEDFAEVGRVCTRVPEAGRQPCFEGIAAAAFTLKDWDPQEIAAACHAIEDDGTKYCMGSMAFTFGIQDTNGMAGDVCSMARSHEIDECRTALARGREVYGDLRSTTEPGQESNSGPAL